MGRRTVTTWTTSTSTRASSCRWPTKPKWRLSFNCTETSPCIKARLCTTTLWCRWRKTWKLRLRPRCIRKWPTSSHIWSNWSRIIMVTCSKCLSTWFKFAARSISYIRVITSSLGMDSPVSNVTSRPNLAGCICSSSPWSSLWSQSSTSRLTKSEMLNSLEHLSPINSSISKLSSRMIRRESSSWE